MNLPSLLLGSVIALGANALLVIPEAIAPQPFNDIQPWEAFAAQQQLVELSCKECPFREIHEDGEVSWSDGFDTSLALNFSLEGGALLVNGRRIFPPPPQTLITAVQRRESDGEESDPIMLGYAVEFMPLSAPDDAPMELSAVRFTVLDLDGHPVPLDTVAITMIRDSRGNVYIAKTDIEEAPNRVPWKQCRGKPKCLRKLLAERIRALFAAAKARVLGMRPRPFGCGAKRPHHRPQVGTDDSFVSEHRPPHHLHNMHQSGWERTTTVSRIIRFIVIPAVLGVLAGLTASALGMLAGQTVIFLWQRYRRSAPRQHEEAGTVSEKEGLMVEASDDLPPAYSGEDSREETSDTKH